MVSPEQDDDESRIAGLEAEERELELRLCALRASIAELKARRASLAHPTEGMRVPLGAPVASSTDAIGGALVGSPASSVRESSVPASEEDSSPLPALRLQPLAKQDPLRAKWGLGDGLPSLSRVSSSQARRLRGALSPEPPPASSLRLFGLVDCGRPWECRIPFSDIMGPDGLTIGRDPVEADIVLPDASVSRRHACFQLSRDGLVITDLESTNGTSVNGHRLSRYERQVPLADGSTLTLGEVTLRVEIIG